MQFLELTMRGVLSFGPDTPPFALRSLNVLIGPNGSGKSNLIEVIGLIRSAATKLAKPIRGSRGSVTDWLWKGDPESIATIGAVVGGHLLPAVMPVSEQLTHLIQFTERASRFTLFNETIEGSALKDGVTKHRMHYTFDHGLEPKILFHEPGREEFQDESVKLDKIDESILTQRLDPVHFPAIYFLSQCYPGICIYREWSFGRNAIFRTPQAADMRHNQLEENYSNLGLFLNYLRSMPKVKNEIISHLRDLYEGLDDFDVRVIGGTVELFLTERDFIIPAGRLSDGTLRYLCLLAILCDPLPPPLICIEEPELGLHPDLLPKIADLLVAASERTQLIVTTHSDILVDALSEQPESVVVFEKHEGKTEFRRLEANDDLKIWLKDYRLGQLWSRGQLGGNRW